MKLSIVALAVCAMTLGAGFLGRNTGNAGVAHAGELRCQGDCEVERAASPLAAFRSGLHLRLAALEDELYRPYHELNVELRRLAGYPMDLR